MFKLLFQSYIYIKGCLLITSLTQNSFYIFCNGIVYLLYHVDTVYGVILNSTINSQLESFSIRF